MFVGKVIGTVWSTVKWEQLGGHKLLLVRPYHLADLIAKGGAGSPDPVARPGLDPQSEAVVCVDLLDAGVGDDVVVAFGHAARVAAQSGGGANQATTTPIDAAVVAIVDVPGISLSWPAPGPDAPGAR